MGYFWNQTPVPIQSSGAVWPASNAQQENEQGQAAGFHLALQHVFGGAAQPVRIMAKKKTPIKLECRLQISLWKLNFTTIQRQPMPKMWAHVRLHVTYMYLVNADCRLCTIRGNQSGAALNIWQRSKRHHVSHQPPRVINSIIFSPPLTLSLYLNSSFLPMWLKMRSCEMRILTAAVSMVSARESNGWRQSAGLTDGGGRGA